MRDIVEELRRMGRAIFIAVDSTVAEDISKKVNTAADEIESLRTRIAEQEWKYVKDGLPTDDSARYDIAVGVKCPRVVRDCSLPYLQSFAYAYRIYRGDQPPPLPDTDTEDGK